MATIMQRLFSPAPPPPAPAPMAPINTGANPNTVANLQDGQSANGPAVKSSALDQFKDVWDPVPADPKNVDPFTQPLLSMDPAKFNETVGKMNFTDGLTAEQIQKAQADPNEFLKVINTIGQRSFAAAAQLSQAAIETSHKTNNERINGSLSKKIRENAVQETRSENPVLNHPAAAPMLDMAKRSIADRNPKATPAEIQSMAEQMLTNFGQELAGHKEASQKPNYDPHDFSDIG